MILYRWVDLRKGMDGLSALVKQALGQALCAGAAFVFRNRAGTRLELLARNGNGVWLRQRRLHRGHFIWPRPEETAFLVTEAHWRWLVAGVDWQCFIDPKIFEQLIASRALQ